MVSRRDEFVKAAWGVAATTLLLTALTWAPFLPSWGARIVPFRPHLAIVALLIAVLLGWMRRPAPAVVWLLISALNGAWVPPRAIPLGPAKAPGRPAHTRPLSVVAYNVNSDSKSFDEVITTLKDADADVIMLEELSPDWKQNLVRLDGYDYRSMYPDASNWGFGLLSRYPIVSSEILPWTGLATAYGLRAQIRMGVDQPGQGTLVTLIGVHTLTPVNDPGVAQRDLQLAAIARLTKGMTDPVIVLGDFNTTPWSTPFHTLLHDSDLRDGAAWRWVGPTWPRMLGPFGLPIDHILVGGSADVDSMRVLPGTGSDHWAIQGTLAIWDPPTAR